MRRHILHIFLMMSVITLTGCSTQKNTAMSRFYHATVARYNVYFNGKQAYLNGCEEQEKAVNDNYLEIIDLFPISDKTAQGTGKSSFDRAIEKSKKCVTLHSIKKRPVKKNGNRGKKQNDKWKSQKEFNPFLWHAWMLMADAQMHEGEFLEAASTYSYISRLYSNEPSIVFEANMKMAQCYSELGWIYEADELFSRITADSIPAALANDYYAIRASHLLKQKRYEESLPLVSQSIRGRKLSKLQKVRENYLIAQLYRETGDLPSAYAYFQKVIRMNPPYRIEFNARIQQTETMTSFSSDAIEKKLRRMAKDPNNRQYLDQVYYAIGNVYLARNDTATAMSMYEIGLDEGKGRTAERGILLLNMATIYWSQADYINAQRCYSEAVGIIDKSHPRYDEVMLRSSVLEKLVEYKSEIELQDSLQLLSSLPEDELLDAIDRAIQKYEKEEQENAEKLRRMEKEALEEESRSAMSVVASDNSWYFYNTALVKEGSAKFTSTWGRRRLEDDWRRQDKSASTDSVPDSTDDGSNGESPADTGENNGEMEENSQDTIPNDPHTREYYMRMIPFTQKQKTESDNILSESLFKIGVIYKDELSEYELAEGNLTRSANEYPSFEYADDALYNLYLMYSLWGRRDDAQAAKEALLEKYPESRYALSLSNPYFEEDVLYGKHREDSLYQVAYNHYVNGNMGSLLECCRKSAERYPDGQLRPKFMFLEASALLSANDTEGFLNILRQIVEKYPSDDLSNLAKLITDNARSGKLLRSASFSSIWDFRNGMEDMDSIQALNRPEFNPERMQDYVIVMAYPTDSLSENQLLFETARYNFTRYMIRNFEMEFRHEGAISMLVIGEFLNFDEAYLYRKRLYDEIGMSEKLDGITTLIITPQNLEILLKYYSFNEYIEFYNGQFLNIPEFDIDGLSIDEELPDDNGHGFTENQ